MQIKCDTHTHTLASDHAYSTILENARFAADRGVELLAITDHAPYMEDSPHRLHFLNYGVLDRTLYGVEMLYGVELDFVDYTGKLSVEEGLCRQMDICIASFHDVVLTPGSRKENTRAYLGAMQHPYVDIIGHPEDGRIPVDYEALVLEAKRTGVLLELNNASLKTAHFRKNTRENAITMLRLCAEHGVSIAVGTDAHFATAVGNPDYAVALLEELGFPEELVVNTDPFRLKTNLEGRL